MSITFERGYSITLAALPISTASLVTSGLVMNLQTAPSSGTTWTSTVSSSFYSASLITAGAGTLTYTGSYGGGIVAGGSNGSTTAICTSYNLTSSFSVEVVVQPNSTNYWAVLWGNEIYSTKGWYAYWGINTSLIAGGPTSNLTYSSPASNANVPVHLIFTLSSGTMRMYKNGVLQTGTGTYAGPSGGVSTTGLNFGSRHPNGTGTANTPTDSLKGVYYQMRVYDRGLSQTEVTQNFDTIKGTYNLS
jgi:Concanavalin A-like lectin/glucanases superfamily